MEGGSRPEDISLLETSGGATPNIIPVQGGGGGGSSGGGSSGGGVPWSGYNEKASVLDAGASNMPIQAVEGGGLVKPAEGGGFLDWLAGNPEKPDFTFNPAASLEETYNSVWNTGLNADEKIKILAKTTMDISRTPADQLSKDEVIPTYLIQNTADILDKKYGKGFDITDENVNKTFYGKTSAEQQAGREAYINAKASNKSDEEAIEGCDESRKGG